MFSYKDYLSMPAICPVLAIQILLPVTLRYFVISMWLIVTTNCFSTFGVIHKHQFSLLKSWDQLINVHWTTGGQSYN